MDIAYLLWLQGIRESVPHFVEQLFVVISAIAASKALIVIPALLFWCLDKRAGRYVLFTFAIGTLANQFVKNTVCAYRPWVRSADVHPSAGALEEATGYSFPSGHTTVSATLLGAIGWWYRKSIPVLTVVCWVFVLLVAFSRNFLGVHTPQDVVVGLLVGILSIAAVSRLLAWVDAGEGRDVRVLVVSLVVTVAFVAYAYLKPYPMDYDASGALMVDPVKMQVDCFKAAGVFVGAVLGWFLEKRYVKFEVDPKKFGWKRMALRFVVGMAVVLALYLCTKPLGAVLVDDRWCELVKNFILVFGAAYLAPLAFTAVERVRYKDA